MSQVISVGISFPKKVLTKIDSERGDISRSRYLLRAIENTLQLEDEDTKEVQGKKNCSIKNTSSNHQDSLDSRSRSLQSSESGNQP